MIYEFITPSDPITFIANDDKVACVCSVLLGEGKAGCNREDGENIPSLWLFHPDPIPEIEKYLECSFGDFIKENKQAISECFKSFSYGHFNDRKQYDAAIEAITDPDKLAKFKNTHEDSNRSSMSKWVAYAWQMGKQMEC
jgi:hypothetical protein